MADAATTTKLAKLLRMLTSIHDGEVLAAVGKINGIVAAYDLDWGQLLGGEPADLTRDQLMRVYQAGYQKGLTEAASKTPQADDWAPAGTSRTTEIGDRRDEVWAILEAAGRANVDHRLSNFERSFSVSMAERLEDWGRRAFVSERQWPVLERLERKLRREGYM